LVTIHGKRKKGGRKERGGEREEKKKEGKGVLRRFEKRNVKKDPPCPLAISFATKRKRKRKEEGGEKQRAARTRECIARLRGKKRKGEKKKHAFHAAPALSKLATFGRTTEEGKKKKGRGKKGEGRREKGGKKGEREERDGACSRGHGQPHPPT